nr:MAG TPA: hypothetical protein [Caudoviricetes sp.]
MMFYVRRTYDTKNELHRIDCKALALCPPYVTSLIVSLLLYCLVLSYNDTCKK